MALHYIAFKADPKFSHWNDFHYMTEIVDSELRERFNKGNPLGDIRVNYEMQVKVYVNARIVDGRVDFERFDYRNLQHVDRAHAITVSDIRNMVEARRGLHVFVAEGDVDAVLKQTG